MITCRFRHMLAKLKIFYLKNGYVMHESVQQPSWMKNAKMVYLFPLGYILGTLLYIYCILGGFNS